MIGHILEQRVSKTEHNIVKQQVNEFEIKVVSIVCTQLLILGVNLLKVNYLKLHFRLSRSEVLR